MKKHRLAALITCRYMYGNFAEKLILNTCADRDFSTNRNGPGFYVFINFRNEISTEPTLIILL